MYQKYSNTHKYYLYRGSDNKYWSISPYSFDKNGYGNVFDIYTRGNLSGATVYSNDLSVAPVINLSAEYVNTMIGDGTIGNEYRVE